MLPSIPLVDEGAHLSVVGDLSERDDAARLVATAVDAFDRVDILVNNAGAVSSVYPRPHRGDAPRDFRPKPMDDALRPPWKHSRMICRRYGRVVSIGAESVRSGLWQHAIYSAPKGGVHGVTPGFVREFAEHGVTFNVVAPATVITPQHAAAVDRMPDEQRREHERFLEQIRGSIPAGRGGTVEEVAAAAAYLASDDAGFVTGQVLSVNRGSSML